MKMAIAFEKPIVRTFDISVFEDEKEYRKAYSAVSMQRRKKVDSCRFKKDKWLSLAAGLLLENGIAELGIENYTIKYNENGKPYLDGVESVFFNLSHSGRYAACAIYNREIGIDIQEIKAVSQKLIRKVATDKELSFLMSLSEKERIEQFVRLWTIKESYVKYIGVSIGSILQSLEASFDGGIQIESNGEKVSVVFEEYDIFGYKMTLCY